PAEDGIRDFHVTGVQTCALPISNKLEQLDLSALRVLGCGAEPNHPDTLRTFVEHFAPAKLRPEALFPVYGMAEATLAMAFSRLEDTLRTDFVCAEAYANEGHAKPYEGKGNNGDGIEVLEYVTCGRPFPGHEVLIIDEDGNPLPDRTLGKVLFRGPSVAAGYYKNADATQDAFRDGGIRTGDLGYIVDGELFVTGRKK